MEWKVSQFQNGVTHSFIPDSKNGCICVFSLFEQPHSKIFFQIIYSQHLPPETNVNRIAVSKFMYAM